MVTVLFTLVERILKYREDLTAGPSKSTSTSEVKLGVGLTRITMCVMNVVCHSDSPVPVTNPTIPAQPSCRAPSPASVFANTGARKDQKKSAKIEAEQ